MHFVVNPYRPFVSTVDGIARAINEIETSSRLRVSSLVSNPNLMSQSSLELFKNGHRLVQESGNALGLSVAFAAASESLSETVDRQQLDVDLLVIRRFFLMFDTLG